MNDYESALAQKMVKMAVVPVAVLKKERDRAARMSKMLRRAVAERKEFYDQKRILSGALLDERSRSAKLVEAVRRACSAETFTHAMDVRFASADAIWEESKARVGFLTKALAEYEATK